MRTIGSRTVGIALGVLVVAALTGATTGISTQQIRTAAPGAVSVSGVTAAEGTSLAVSRADHNHSLTGTLPQARGGTGSGALTCTGTQKLTSNGTAYSCAEDQATVYTLPAAATNTLGGVKGTGTALACTLPLVATGFNAAGALQCGQPTTISGVLPVANGGTGSSAAVTAGGIAYGTASGTIATSAVGGIGQLLQGAGAGAPNWANMGDLNVGHAATADVATSAATANTVSGVLPVANGGTNSTATPTAGGIGYGTGSAHAYTAAPGAADRFLVSTATATPTWLTTVPVASGGTGNGAAPTVGGVIYGSTIGPSFQSTAAGTAGWLLSANGASSPNWINPATLSVASAASATNATNATNVTGTVSVYNGGTGKNSAPNVGGVAYGSTIGPSIQTTLAGTAGQILLSGGAGSPTWGVSQDQIVHGAYPPGSNAAPATWAASDDSQWRAGFWDVSAASWMPTADWYWGATFPHRSNSASYNYSGQLAFRYLSGGQGLYARTIDNGVPTAWSLLLTPSTVGTYALPIGGGTLTGALAVTGAITATGDITAYSASDRRLKDRVHVIDDPLDKLAALHGVEWEWNAQSGKTGPGAGLIAQDVAKVVPTAVGEMGNGYLGLRVGDQGVVALLVEGMKAQQARIDDLERRLSKLEASCAR